MIAIFPEIYACAARAEVEKLAILVRLYFASAEAKRPRLNLERMLANFGILITWTPCVELATMVVVDEQGEFKITFLLRRGIGTHEKDFLLAHLLGYFLLVVQPRIAAGDYRTGGYQVMESPLGRFTAGKPRRDEPEEAAQELADAFAAALLLPKGMFLRAQERLPDLQAVAQFFAVSLACAQRRQAMLATLRAPTVKGPQTRQILGAYEGHQKLKPSPRNEPASQQAEAVGNHDAAGSVSLEPSANSPRNAASSTRGASALKRIRKLAKKLDESVKI